jgi:hypothetical protein
MRTTVGAVVVGGLLILGGCGEQLPAGIVVVEAEVSIGIGPGPVPPDLDAPELPCRLEVEVPDGGRVDVEVSFQPEGDCLRKV